jgi:DNA-binding transcriptional MerR regulator
MKEGRVWMLLKIGELAKRTGLTVRTLHHYDAVKLLSPSARTDAGYRLYNQNDIARLHQIQAMRSFGMSLSDIGAYLTRPDLPLAAVVARQIAMLDQQIAQASLLRGRLSRLHGQLAAGQGPDLADWLTTLEHMSMYDKYFTQEELKQLPLYTDAAARAHEWKPLVARVSALMASGAGPADARAQALATEWMAKVVRDTGGNPVLFNKLNTMHEREPSVQDETGITPALMGYVIAAAHEARCAAYRNYLDDDEYAYLRANIGKRSAEWPGLVAQVRIAMDEGRAPGSPEVQALARHWFDLFRSYAGDNPATQLRIRQALENEPALTNTGWVDAPMRAFIRAALEAMRAQAAR